MGEIARRATIEELVATHDRAIAMYSEAWAAIGAADAAVKAAAEMASRCSPGINLYNYGHEEELKAFFGAVKLPDRDQYLRTARKLVAINAWSWIIERTDLERLMDKEAKDQLRAQLAFVPDRVDGSGQLITGDEAGRGMPPLTVENIMATLERFRDEADMIFRRGIANVFSKLDRRFRSHDGFKIGSRMILTYVFDGYGHLNWGRVRDQLIDIERVFAVLDGKPESGFRSALGAMEQERRIGLGGGARQSVTETDYFRIKGFKNGNAHLWFTRDDLVGKVNKLLAEYYGEVIGDGQKKEADPFADVKHLPARYYGFFPTPSAAAEAVMAGAILHRDQGAPPLRILEPSAGTGNLARLCAAKKEGGGWRDEPRYYYRAMVDCVEIQPHLADALTAEGIYNRVFCQDFLRLQPTTTGLYDRVIMNPPFDRERDIDHVMHAWGFLKPDGMLIAIMSAGTEFRGTKKATAFRALVEKMGGSFEDLPPGSFAESGTYVNTVIVRVRKDGRGVKRWQF